MEDDLGSTRDPLTLRFLDPRLERDFQAEMAATNGPQARVGRGSRDRPLARSPR